MPGGFKGTEFRKIEWEVVYLPRMNSLKFNFLDICKTKTARCVYREYAKRRNKHWPLISKVFGFLPHTQSAVKKKIIGRPKSKVGCGCF